MYTCTRRRQELQTHPLLPAQEAFKPPGGQLTQKEDPYQSLPPADPYKTRPLIDPSPSRPSADPFQPHPPAKLYQSRPPADPYQPRPPADPSQSRPPADPYKTNSASEANSQKGLSSETTNGSPPMQLVSPSTPSRHHSLTAQRSSSSIKTNTVSSSLNQRVTGSGLNSQPCERKDISQRALPVLFSAEPQVSQPLTAVTKNLRSSSASPPLGRPLMTSSPVLGSRPHNTSPASGLAATTNPVQGHLLTASSAHERLPLTPCPSRASPAHSSHLTNHPASALPVATNAAQGRPPTAAVTPQKPPPLRTEDKGILRRCHSLGTPRQDRKVGGQIV